MTPSEAVTWVPLLLDLDLGVAPASGPAAWLAVRPELAVHPDTLAIAVHGPT